MGYSNDDGYLCCVDTSEATRASTGIEFSWISDRMRRSKAGAVVAIFDCCFAGRLKSGNAPGVSKVPFSGTGVHYLGSSSANVGSDDAAKRGQSSPFTAAVVQGLRSDLTGPLHGFVSVQDLQQHLANTVMAPQPEFSARKLDGRPIAIGRTTAAARSTISPNASRPQPAPAVTADRYASTKAVETDVDLSTQLKPSRGLLTFESDLELVGFEPAHLVRVAVQTTVLHRSELEVHEFPGFEPPKSFVHFDAALSMFDPTPELLSKGGTIDLVQESSIDVEKCVQCRGDGKLPNQCRECDGIGSVWTTERQACHCRTTAKLQTSEPIILISTWAPPVVCADCGGTGEVAKQVPKVCDACMGTTKANCSKCKGSGSVTRCRIGRISVEVGAVRVLASQSLVDDIIFDTDSRGFRLGQRTTGVRPKPQSVATLDDAVQFGAVVDDAQRQLISESDGPDRISRTKIEVLPAFVATYRTHVTKRIGGARTPQTRHAIASSPSGAMTPVEAVSRRRTEVTGVAAAVALLAVTCFFGYRMASKPLRQATAVADVSTTIAVVSTTIPALQPPISLVTAARPPVVLTQPITRTDPVEFVRSYLSAADAGDCESAWAQLSPHFISVQGLVFTGYCDWFQDRDLADISLALEVNLPNDTRVRARFRSTSLSTGKELQHDILYQVRWQPSGKWLFFDQGD